MTLQNRKKRNVSDYPLRRLVLPKYNYLVTSLNKNLHSGT